MLSEGYVNLGHETEVMSLKEKMPFVSNVDRLVMEISSEDRHAVIKEFEEFERSGAFADDGALRFHARDIYEKVHGKDIGFDANYLVVVGYSARKVSLFRDQSAPIFHEET